MLVFSDNDCTNLAATTTARALQSSSLAPARSSRSTVERSRFAQANTRGVTLSSLVTPRGEFACKKEQMTIGFTAEQISRVQVLGADSRVKSSSPAFT